MIKQNMKYLNRIFVFLDVILISVALFFAWFIRIRSGLMVVEAYYLPFWDYMQPLIFLIPTYLILYQIFDLYKPHRTKSLYDELINLVKANTSGILVFLSYLYLFRMVDYSRKVLIIFYILSIGFAFIERLIIRYSLRNLRSQRKNLKYVVLVGYSDLAIEYSKRIYQNKHWGYFINGVFDNTATGGYEAGKEQKTVKLYNKSEALLGRLEDLGDYIAFHDIDEVIITLTLKDYGILESVVEICEKQGVYTRIIPDYYRIIPSRPYIEDVDGLPMISIRKVPLNDLIKKSSKRMVDVLCSLAGIIILSPFFLLISLLIRSDSKGPIVFRQKRIGLNRHEFDMYKFRTMVLQDDEEEKDGWTVKNDPRITRIGKFLRRTSIDEFPQLLNVLKGDMSLIGPRPERPQFVEKYKEEIPKYMVKHQVRPGMTGWAQIHGLRGDTSIEKRIEYDLYYIENWSVKLELKIFFLTFLKGFLNKNAY